MPNWCNNGLTLTHKDPARLDAAIKAYEEGRFLEHFVPFPSGEWNYDFCVSNWGTKWDVGGRGDMCNRLDPNNASFGFDSAWAPPIAAYERMCAEGFEVEAYYWEPGMAFCGKFTGNELESYDDYYEYDGTEPDNVRKAIGEDIDDYFNISQNLNEWQDQEEEFLEDDRENNLPPHTD